MAKSVKVIKKSEQKVKQQTDLLKSETGFDFRQGFHASGLVLPLKFKLRFLDIFLDVFCHFISTK